MSSHIFTAESVSEGHPDKLADQVSDTILDAILKQDPKGRVAVETLLTKGLVVIAGEVTTEANIDIPELVRNKILDVGYDDEEIGFNGATCALTIAISQQSPEIASGVFNAVEGRTAAFKDTRSEIEKQGAGDQGIIFGYANSDNEDYFPIGGKIAHLLTAKHTELRKNGKGKGILLPDAKSQVSIQYEDGIPVGIDSILISTQHAKNISLNEIQDFVRMELIRPVLADYIETQHFGTTLIDSENYLINPAGTWNFGGPGADAGLTGRKIIVDSYNGYARHGGGCHSGKDVTKVDRSAAYALRWVAKNLVAAGAAEELELQIAYAIGSSLPVSIHVDTKGKRSVGASKIKGIINEIFDLRPGAILQDLSLREIQIYAETARNGHFGRENILFPWERLDKVEEIKQYL
jgi:S-adenosylmethionine synthetase